MASNNQIVKKSIQIDASDTIRTVKSLKQEISDLRDELLNLEKGTEEYDEVQKKLTEDVNDLNEVMGAHKDKAQSLEGSYNSLQEQLKDLKKAWKETNDEAERNELGQQIRNLNDQLKEMDASIGDFHRNVGNYESAWNGLSGVMENGEKITDDLEKGIKAFGSAMGLTEKQASSLSKTLKSLKDGFKIAKDIAKAREESTKLATAEQQAAAGGTALATSQKAAGTAAKTMAASEGTATVATKGLSVAMKGLKAALISTGIGALIMALGALVGLIDKAIGKLKEENFEKKYGKITDAYNNHLKIGKEEYDLVEKKQHALELDIRLANARKESEGEILELQKERTEALIEDAKAGQVAARVAKEGFDIWLAAQSESVKNSEEMKDLAQKNTADYEMWNSKVEELEDNLQDINDDILVYNEEQKNTAKNAREELIKWTEAVTDPEFREAWKSIFSMRFAKGDSPVETLKIQYAQAMKLAKAWNVETAEIDAFFKDMIADAEETFRSISEMENKIYLEGLSPLDQLEQEKEDWIKKYEEWGQDTYFLTKYYDKKIQEERDRAEKERKEKEDAAEEARMKELNDFLANVDTTLATNEKLDELFSPIFAQFTSHEGVAGEIQQDIDNLKRLYDTQMSYLNSLLEGADLTEEAYAGIEERILSLTVEFNNQMDALKAEQDYQGKNFALLTKKQVANWNLMESAVADFSDAFQTAGLENSKAYKGFATAQALISSMLAFNRVLAEEPGGIVVKTAAAVAALAAGLANVYAIWAVNPDGSNASSAAGSAGGNISATATPSLINSEPYSYTSVIQDVDKQDEFNKYNLVVSVVDIEDAMETRRVRVTESTF